jgi:tetratricopeptide (TPR) repeat protein
MNYSEYADRMRQGADAVDAGRRDLALEIFKDLLTTGISPIDKAVVCVNLATISDQLGEPERALIYYDRGIAYEQALCRTFAAEAQAAYLHRLGRLRESLRAYEELRRGGWLSEADKQRIDVNITTIKQQLASRRA